MVRLEMQHNFRQEGRIDLPTS